MRRMGRGWAAILLSLAVGVASGQEIKIGDAREKVIATMGSPKNRMALGRQEILAYEQAEITLRDGVVESVQRRSARPATPVRAKESAAGRQQVPNRDAPPAPVPSPPATPAVNGAGQMRAALLADNARWHGVIKASLQEQIASERELLDNELVARKAQLEADIAKYEKELTDLPRRKEDFEACVARRLALPDKVAEAHKRYIASGRTDCPIQLDFEALRLSRPGREYGTVMDVRFPRNSEAVRDIPASELRGCGQMATVLRDRVGHGPGTTVAP